MIYRILGELAVGLGGGSRELPAGHTLRVFAALLIHANRWISKPDLLRAGWGDAPVGEAQLPKHIGYLREFLAPVGQETSLVTRRQFGYELKVAEDDMDMLRFLRLTRQADEAGLSQRTDREIELLRQALDLWRGHTVMSNVVREGFAHEAERLELRRMRAAIRYFDLQMKWDRHDVILDDLKGLAAHHPTDRTLCEQLMKTLHRCGHVTAAVEVFERYEAALAEAIGAEPDGELRRLAYQIGGGGEVPAPQSERRGGSVPRQLPRDISDYMGRNELMAEVVWLLGQPDRTVPVVVVSGTGGIGKTALAVHAAHEVGNWYPDGQLYIDLRGTSARPSDSTEVLAQFLRSFGVPKIPQTHQERLALYHTTLADRRVLVVLDDAKDEDQVRDLLPSNEKCGVIITTRRKLPDISGVHHIDQLEPLPHSVAKDLFVCIVRNGGITLQAEAAAVEQVVALCSGLPLAIRIAAAIRVQDHPRTTRDLLELLQEQGSQALTYGKHSLARSVGAGFALLDDAAQQLFLRLGLVQLPSFGLWTATALLEGVSTDAEAALAQLIAGSMVQPADQEGRYRLHDLTREYARQRAVTEYEWEGDVRDVQMAAYTALLTLVRRAHRGSYGGDYEVVHSAAADWNAPDAVLAEVDSDTAAWFDKERANLRAAVEHCAELGFADICWDLALSSHEFYTIKGLFDDWYATHSIALRACRSHGDVLGEAMLLTSLGQPAFVASRRSGGASGPDDLRHAVRLLADCDNDHGQAIALRTLANALRRRGQLVEPLALFKKALELYVASGDVLGRWQALRFIGQTYLDLDDRQEALTVLLQAAADAKALGWKRLIAQSEYWVGQAYLAVGDAVNARSAFEAMLKIFGDAPGLGHAYAAHGLGDVARMEGEPVEAERLLAVAASEAHDAADAMLEGRVWLSLAGLSVGLGQLDRRITALLRAAACFAAGDAAYLEAQALSALRQAHADAGDAPAAEAVAKRVAILHTVMGLPEEDRRRRRPPF